MRGLFFFGLGVGATVFAVVKGRELARKATPAHLQQTAASRANELLDQVSDFFTTVKTSMDEREGELRRELGMEKA